LTDAPHAVSVLDVVDTVAGVVLCVVAVVLLVRRWRRATATLRRAMWPMLIAGGAALAALVVGGLISVLVSSVASDIVGPAFLLAFLAVPIAFLFGILRVRLARSSVSELVVALEAGEPLRDALARAVGDPGLEVVYRLHERHQLGDTAWVDPQG